MKRSHALPWQPARDPEPGPGGRLPPIAHKARSDVMIWLGVSKFTHFAATHLTLHWDTPDCFLLLMLELKQAFYFSLFFHIAKKAKAGKEPTGKTVTLLLKDDLTKLEKKKISALMLFPHHLLREDSGVRAKHPRAQMQSRPHQAWVKCHFTI